MSEKSKILNWMTHLVRNEFWLHHIWLLCHQTDISNIDLYKRRFRNYYFINIWLKNWIFFDWGCFNSNNLRLKQGIIIISQIYGKWIKVNILRLWGSSSLFDGSYYLKPRRRERMPFTPVPNFEKSCN